MAEDTFNDTRDGKVYKTVKIGNQIWMAENLNYNAPGSVCYDNDPKNGEKYGRLYDWETAKKACPVGWHLPSKDEWDALSGFVGGSSVEGKFLKATTGWNGSGNGQDTYGFAALPGGHGDSGEFGFVGNNGYWWTTSEYGKYDHAYMRQIGNIGESALWNSYGKHGQFSVRCVKD